MKTNPGGQLAPNDVVGRDLLIERLWQILARQSLVLTAERRMGKTSIVKKMAAQPKDGIRVFWRDVEALRSPLEFVDAVLRDVQDDLSRKQQVMNRVRELMQQIGGLEFQGVKLPPQVAPHWKILLTKTLEDLVEHHMEVVIFCWDELPMMLDNIKQDKGETIAMEVLDTLRSLRQMFPTIRMVFTGSIGLHHVLSHLKEAGYVNDPTNDMFKQDVPPFEWGDACNLAEQLLQGERIWVEDNKELARAIAKAVDCFPYYIHHVVDAMKWIDEPKNLALVEEVILSGLCDDGNRWDMAHYHDRISTYYAETDQKLTLAILDELAQTDLSLSFLELCNRLGMQMTSPEPEQVRKLLTLLRRDHYLIQQPDGLYRFKFGLIQRYWRLCRGL
jgi:hypothetical protein